MVWRSLCRLLDVRNVVAQAPMIRPTEHKAVAWFSRFCNGSALSLGIARSFVHGTFLLATIVTSFSALGQLPVTILRPNGLMQVLPWSFYDHLLSPWGMFVFKGVMLLSLVMSTVGLFTSLSTKLSVALVLLYQGLVRSFGHFNHDEMLAVYFLAVLAFAPCGDQFSIDHWAKRKQPNNPNIAYGYPVLLMQLLLAW